VTGIPVGAECEVTEVDDGGADETPEPVTVTIPDQEVDGVETVVTAGFVNEFSLGLLGIAKHVDGEAAEAPWVQDAVFTIQVTCELEVDGIRTTVYSSATELTAGDIEPLRGADGRVVRLPVGTHCYGTETNPAGATSSSIDHDSYDNAIIVEEQRLPQILLVTATNTFEYGEIELEKTISGSTAAAAGKTFTVEVTCTLDRGPNNEPYLALDHESVQITGGQTVALDELPVGAECWAEEVDAGGATETTVSATEATPAIVGDDEIVTIAVDNRFAPPLPATGFDGDALAARLTWALLLTSGGLALVAFVLVRRRRYEVAAIRRVR